MRFLLTVALISGGAWLVYKNWDAPISSFDDLLSISKIQNENTTLINSAGVELECRVIAKKADFIVIERTSDSGVFLLNSNRLSNKSRRKVSYSKDFNESTVNEHLFHEAQKSIQAELLYVKEFIYYTCPRNGQRMESCHSKRVDEYRDFLIAQSVKYRESALDTQPRGDHSVYLPQGIKGVPCIRIGDEILYSKDSAKLKELMADAYYTEYNSQNL